MRQINREQNTEMLVDYKIQFVLFHLRRNYVSLSREVTVVVVVVGE